MVLGTEDATPLTFWVGVATDAYLQLDDAVIVDAEVPGRGSLRGSPASSRTCARGTRAPRSTPTCSSSTGGCCPSTPRSPRRSSRPGSSPRSSCRRCRGSPPLRARGKDRDEALYFDQMARRLAARAHARRRARLPRPRLPRRLARRARQHLGHLGRRDEDHLRAVPALRAVPLATCSAGTRANTKAIVFNVKGEDLMWLDTAERPPHRRRPRGLRAARPAAPGRSSGGPVGAGSPRRRRRGDPARRGPERGRRRLLLDRPRVRPRDASCGSCSRRPTTSARRSPTSSRGSRRISTASARTIPRTTPPSPSAATRSSTSSSCARSSATELDDGRLVVARPRQRRDRQRVPPAARRRAVPRWAT